jgi:hypothetical protein
MEVSGQLHASAVLLSVHFAQEAGWTTADLGDVEDKGKNLLHLPGIEPWASSP